MTQDLGLFTNSGINPGFSVLPVGFILLEETP